jgi:hypothetical protein
VADVIDTQVSFGTTLSLQNDTEFKKRVYKMMMLLEDARA